MRNCTNLENTSKIKAFGKSILFCEYLCIKSSDLHEILYGGQLLSCELKFQIFEDPFTNAHTQVVNAHTRDKTYACASTTCVRTFGNRSL